MSRQTQNMLEGTQFWPGDALGYPRKSCRTWLKRKMSALHWAAATATSTKIGSKKCIDQGCQTYSPRAKVQRSHEFQFSNKMHCYSYLSNGGCAVLIRVAGPLLDMLFTQEPPGGNVWRMEKSGHSVGFS